jgi:hypothetical protein
MALSIGFSSSLTLPPAIQATRRLTSTLMGLFPLNTPAFAGRTAAVKSLLRNSVLLQKESSELTYASVALYFGVTSIKGTRTAIQPLQFMYVLISRSSLRGLACPPPIRTSIAWRVLRRFRGGNALFGVALHLLGSSSICGLGLASGWGGIRRSMVHYLE